MLVFIDNQSYGVLPLLQIRRWLVISHLISLNSESINLGSFVEQKYLFLLADKSIVSLPKSSANRAELQGHKER